MTQEILTPEEFAQRLKIGRSTLFEWLSKGILIQGKHYFRVGRILRFAWSQELVADLLSISAGVGVTGDQAAQVMSPTRRYGSGVARGKPKINWEY